MIIFLGGLAALFHFFLAGVFWPNREHHELGVTVWSIFVKAIYISWFLFLISFYTPIGRVAALLVAAGCITAIYLLWSSKKWAFESPPINTSLSSKFVLFLCMTAIVLLSGPIIKSVGTIYVDWDPVASWNNWAIDLSANRYKPYNAAYPILYPALWSQIYEAQGTADIWFIPKATLIIAPLFLLTLFVSEAIYGRRGIAALGLVLLVAFLLSDYNDKVSYVTSGHMDWPVAFLGCAAAMLGMMSMRAYDNGDSRMVELSTISVITASVATITKQPGVLFLAASFFTPAALSIFGKLKIKSAITVALLSLLPILTFLFLFSTSGDREIIGNIDQLSSLSEASLGENRLGAAYELLFSPVKIGWVILLLGGALLNVFFLRKKMQALYSVFLCILFIVGFLIFADCCSYDRRNGVWLFGLAIPAAMSGWSLAGTELLRRYNHFSFPQKKNAESLFLRDWSIAPLAAIFVALLAAATIMDDATALGRQIDAQKNIGAGRANQFLYSNEAKMKDAHVIISYYQVMRYLPGFSTRYQYCPINDFECVKRKISQSGKSKAVIFYHKGMANAQSRIAFEKMIANNEVYVLAESERFRLLATKNKDTLKST